MGWRGSDVVTVLVYNLTRVFMELGMFDASWIGELDPSSALLTVCTAVVERGVYPCRPKV